MLNKIRNRKLRLKLSVTAGILTVMIAGGNMKTDRSMMLGWWGTLYPKFCFGKEYTEGKTQEKYDKPKVSFWLAKALERW